MRLTLQFEHAFESVGRRAGRRRRRVCLERQRLRVRETLPAIAPPSTADPSTGLCCRAERNRTKAKCRRDSMTMRRTRGFSH